MMKPQIRAANSFGSVLRAIWMSLCLLTGMGLFAAAPTITQQPLSQVVNPGQTATFSVTASGFPTPTYQWYRGGSAISGATASTYSFTTTPADGGATFYVKATNFWGNVTSSTATLTLNVAPAITTQPHSLTVNTGQSATFSVTATGTPAPTYAWYHGLGVNGPIAGATSSTFTIASATIGDAGSYYVEVSNSAGSEISNSGNNPAILTVNAPPVITAQPANQTVTAGQTATFSVTATGNPTPTYQWKKNGVAITGATASSYTTPATVVGDSGAVFSVVATNAGGSATSANATLTVQPVVPPSITTQPQSITVTTGQSATFSITASGTAPFTYQWSKNGVAISGATTSSYTTPATVSGDNGAAFSVVVSNSAGGATSANAILTVQPPSAPTITAQPLSATVPEGQTATFSVSASGTAPLAYQWKKNGATLVGATDSTYTTPPTAPADNGALFSVVVSNSLGSVTSANATLTVQPAPPFITAQPQSLTVTAGQPATFSVTVTGTAPFTYQWKKAGISIAGATNSTYTLAAATAADAGNYTVAISNSVGNTTSSSASLTVNPAPAITVTVTPAAASMLVGGSQALTATVNGTTNTAVTWTTSGGTLSGTGLSVTWIAPQVAGTYTITARSQADTAQTATATIRVNPVICAL